MKKLIVAVAMFGLSGVASAEPLINTFFIKYLIHGGTYAVVVDAVQNSGNKMCSTLVKAEGANYQFEQTQECK